MASQDVTPPPLIQPVLISEVKISTGGAVSPSTLIDGINVTPNKKVKNMMILVRILRFCVV